MQNQSKHATLALASLLGHDFFAFEEVDAQRNHEQKHSAGRLTPRTAANRTDYMPIVLRFKELDYKVANRLERFLIIPHDSKKEPEELKEQRTNLSQALDYLFALCPEITTSPKLGNLVLGKGEPSYKLHPKLVMLLNVLSLIMVETQVQNKKDMVKLTKQQAEQILEFCVKKCKIGLLNIDANNHTIYAIELFLDVLNKLKKHNKITQENLNKIIVSEYVVLYKRIMLAQPDTLQDTIDGKTPAASPPNSSSLIITALPPSPLTPHNTTSSASPSNSSSFAKTALPASPLTPYNTLSLIAKMTTTATEEKSVPAQEEIRQLGNVFLIFARNSRNECSMIVVGHDLTFPLTADEFIGIMKVQPLTKAHLYKCEALQYEKIFTSEKSDALNLIRFFKLLRSISGEDGLSPASWDTVLKYEEMLSTPNRVSPSSKFAPSGSTQG